MLRALLLLGTLAQTAAQVAADPWEWKGAFAVADAEHTWIMQKVKGAYADQTMKLVMIPTSTPDKYAETTLAATAKSLWNTCTDKKGKKPDHSHRRLSDRRLSGDDLEVPAGGACYNLVVDDNLYESNWHIETKSLTGIVFYAQHVPTEFEDTKHYFQDSKEVDIEPAKWHKRWGGAIAASCIVALVTFTGVILLIPGVSGLYKANPNAFRAISNASAAAALIAAAYYVMLFEGSHYVAVGAASESQTAFLWGTMVLLGVITASVLELINSLILPIIAPVSTATAAASDVESKGAGKAASPEGVEVVSIEGQFQRQTRVRCGILIGDFMHNLCDGIFIGTAFSSCSDSLAWNITVATIAHEIAQEISDYVVLTDPKQGNLSPMRALALNFVSGLSVVLGVLIVMSMSKMDDRAIGMILTFGGGIYIQIGLAECMARVYSHASNAKLKVSAILAFVCGAIAIGLVLLDHKHCSAGGDAHAGHNHGGGAVDAHAGHNHGRLLSLAF